MQAGCCGNACFDLCNSVDQYCLNTSRPKDNHTISRVLASPRGRTFHRPHHFGRTLETGTLTYGRGPPGPVVSGVLRTPDGVVNLRPKAMQGPRKATCARGAKAMFVAAADHSTLPVPSRAPQTIRLLPRRHSVPSTECRR